MPLAVYVLGLSIFAQGTSELMLAGLLPDIGSGLGVSIPATGLLISAFALGMFLGAPVLAVLTLRWPRRRSLLVFLAVFAAAHVLGALTPNYAVLLASRVLGAFVYAGFWAVATVTAIRLVPANRRGRAMGVVTSGLTLATVIGLPLGTLIGQHLGWRAAFWMVAVFAVLAMAGVLATVPEGAPQPDALPALRPELRAMANPRLWLAYGTTAATTGSGIVIFSYLTPLLVTSAGFADGWVPALLALSGIGAFIGITIGGRTADAAPLRTLFLGITGMIVLAVLFALLVRQPVVAIGLVFLLGAFGFATNPSLNARVFSFAEAAPTLATSANVSAFNVGIMVGPWLGGLAIGAGWGYPSVVWIGAGLGVVAFGTVALAAALSRRPVPAPVG